MRLALRSLGLLWLLVTTSWAADYRCTLDNGCTAHIYQNGQLQAVHFDKNAVVATEAGWVVNTAEGWNPIG